MTRILAYVTMDSVSRSVTPDGRLAKGGTVVSIAEPERSSYFAELDEQVSRLVKAYKTSRKGCMS